MIYSRKQVKHLKKIHKYKNQCIVKLLNIFKDRFPVINNLIQKINLRKRRDTIILASVIATCTILLMLYAFHWRVPVISVWERVSCGTVVSEWDRESLIAMFRRCWWSMKLWWVINHWPSFKLSFSCVFKLLVLITILFELGYSVFNPIHSSCYLRFIFKLFWKCFKKCIYRYQYILLYVGKTRRVNFNQLWILIGIYHIHSVYCVILTTFLMWNWCSFLMVTLYKCIALYWNTF